MGSLSPARREDIGSLSVRVIGRDFSARNDVEQELPWDRVTNVDPLPRLDDPRSLTLTAESFDDSEHSLIGTGCGSHRAGNSCSRSLCNAVSDFGNCAFRESRSRRAFLGERCCL